MTQAQGHANWAGNPSLCDLLIASTLRTLAMLMSIVARLFRVPHQTQTAECDGGPAQAPEADTVSTSIRKQQQQQQQQENNNATATGKQQHEATLTKPSW